MRSVLGHLPASEQPIVLAALRSLRRALSAEAESGAVHEHHFAEIGELAKASVQPATQGRVPQQSKEVQWNRSRQQDVIEPTLADDPALGLSQRTKFEILGAIMLGLFLGALDQTIVGPVLPTIVTQLKGADYYTWVVTVYLLTSTVSVPIYGKLSDMYGRKQLLMGGIVLFLIGSALSGLSGEMWQLILFRGIQGLGAGALFPISLAVIGDLFSPAERGKYQGLFGLVFGVSFIIGPLLGGWLTTTFSWHWIFYVNVPVGLAALFVIGRLLPNIHHPARSAKIDYLGVATLVLGLVPILIGFTPGRDAPLQRPERLELARRRRRVPRPVRLRRVAGGGADHPAPPVPQPDVLGVDGRDLLRDVRLRRLDHLPAAVLPGRPGRRPDDVRPEALPVPHRAHRLVDRLGLHRQPNRALQDGRRRRPGDHDGRPRPDDPAPATPRTTSCCGPGCSWPASASGRRSRSSRSSSRTPWTSTRWAPRPAT